MGVGVGVGDEVGVEAGVEVAADDGDEAVEEFLGFGGRVVNRS